MNHSTSRVNYQFLSAIDDAIAASVRLPQTDDERAAFLSASLLWSVIQAFTILTVNGYEPDRDQAAVTEVERAVRDALLLALRPHMTKAG